MRQIVWLFFPTLALALAPTLVGTRPVSSDAAVFESPRGRYRAVVEYSEGNSEFVPFRRFELQDRDGRVLYSRPGNDLTVLDVSDQGTVVGADFDGPVSGHAKIHFFDRAGTEQGTAEVGFWRLGRFSADGSKYCVYDGRQGLRVFSSAGEELHDLGTCTRFGMSADGRRVAVVRDSTIVLYEDGKAGSQVRLASPFVRQVALSPDGERLGFIERRTLNAYRFADGALLFRYRPEDAARQFISLDVAAEYIAAGLDVDAGRGTAGRHRRGLVTLLDSAGAVVWEQELRYDRWHIAVPAVRFAGSRGLRVETADEVREYVIEEEK